LLQENALPGLVPLGPRVWSIRVRRPCTSEFLFGRVTKSEAL